MNNEYSGLLPMIKSKSNKTDYELHKDPAQPVKSFFHIESLKPAAKAARRRSRRASVGSR